MKTKLLTITAALLLSAATASAEMVIAAGKQGGGYEKRAMQIAERMGQRGLPATVLNTNGSEEISLTLCNGRAQIGIMQIDAIYGRALEGCDLKSIAVYGQEVAVLMFPPKSNKDELSDLDASDTIMVDGVGSGNELFWRTIAKIETGDEGSGDEWASAKVSNDPLELAQPNAEMGDVTAVLLVRKPDSADIARLIELGWSAGELWDRDINDLLFKNTALYDPQKIEIGGDDAWVYDVRSFVVVKQSLASGDRKVFAAITAAAQ